MAYPISTTVKSALDNAQYQSCSLTITKSGQTTLHLTEAHLFGLTLDRTTMFGNSLAIGTAIANELTIQLDNHLGAYDNYDFEGAEIYAVIGCGGGTIPLGYFKVMEQPELNKDVVMLTAYDRMIRFDGIADFSDLTFPCTVAQLIVWVCGKCGMSYEYTTGLPNRLYQINEKPATQNVTYRQLIAWCAEIQGCCAYINYAGTLAWGVYNTSSPVLTLMPSHRYTSDVAGKNITISGVRVIDAYGKSYESGSSNYMITISGNDLIQHDHQIVVNALGAVYNGFAYRPCSSATVPYPHLFPCDTYVYRYINHSGSTVSVNAIVGHLRYVMNGRTTVEGRGDSQAAYSSSNYGSFISSGGIKPNMLMMDGVKFLENGVIFGTTNSPANAQVRIYVDTSTPIPTLHFLLGNTSGTPYISLETDEDGITEGKIHNGWKVFRSGNQEWIDLETWLDELDSASPSIEIDGVTIVKNADGEISVSTAWGDGRYSLVSHNHSGVYSPVGHTHSKSQITDFPATMPPSAHSHNGGDINHGESLSVDSGGNLDVSTTWLNARYASKSHNHSKSEITDFPTSLPASDVYAWAKAASKPLYSWPEIASKPSWIGDSKPAYTYSEVGAAASNHNHAGIYAPFQHAHQGSEIDHDGTLAVTSDGELSVSTTWLNSNYAAKTHNHSGTYSPVGHTHTQNDITGSISAGKLTLDEYGSLIDVDGQLRVDMAWLMQQSVGYAEIAGSAPQTWRPIKVNGINFITDNVTAVNFVQGNHISLRKVGTDKIVIDYDSTCLIEGTLITMADGSQKPIEEIQKGDKIMSYDPTTGATVFAFALDLECTGSTNEYKYSIFDDGSEIVTYGNHSLYSADLGYPKDIEKWQFGDKGINIDGDTIEMLDQGIVRYKGTWKRHYVLYSSNNLYFANNILTCHWGSTKYKHLKDFELDQELPAAVMDVYEEEEHKYGDKGQWMLSREYVNELVAVRKRRNLLDKIIVESKRKLNETDYIGQKYIEGLISAVEWLRHKTERAEWRKLINDNEVELADLEKQIRSIKRKYKTPHSQRERFAEYVTMCNSVYEDLENFYKT